MILRDKTRVVVVVERGGGGAGGLQKGAGALRGVKEGMNDRPLRYTPDHRLCARLQLCC